MNRFAEAIQAARVDVVPRIVMSNQGAGENNGGGMGGGLIEGLLAMLMSEKMGESVAAAPSAVRDPEVESFRSQVRQNLTSTLGSPKSEQP
jgi:hypothetical protein